VAPGTGSQFTVRETVETPVNHGAPGASGTVEVEARGDQAPNPPSAFAARTR
jgi:hypothetical protein